MHAGLPPGQLFRPIGQFQFDQIELVESQLTSSLGT